MQEARAGRRLRRAREGGEATAGDRRASSRRKLGKEAPAGGSPQTLVAERLTECRLHAEVSSFQTVGCIMRIEMRAGRFAVMNQANHRCRPDHLYFETA